uniref:ARAD1D13266p n=1 Tax=Blastobotrys adeninivorans TaxID=409370 RepID=A0A060T8Q9_BLAAD
METFRLERLLKSIDESTSKVEALEPHSSKPFDPKVFVVSLELDKISANIDHARSILLDLEAANTTSSLSSQRAQLKALNGRIQKIQHTVRVARNRDESSFKQHQEEEQAKRRQSTSSGSSHLKHRSSTSISHPSGEKRDASVGESSGLEEKLSVHRTTQETVSSEILDMVSKIKENAMKFADKVAQDRDIVQNTSDALHKSAGSMDKVGSRLNSWQATSAIGWKFYIYAALFLVLSVIMGLFLVHLPKW